MLEPILAVIEFVRNGEPIIERIVCLVTEDGELQTDLGDDIGWPVEVIKAWTPLPQWLAAQDKEKADG